MIIRAKYWIIGSLIHDSTFAAQNGSERTWFEISNVGKRAFSNNTVHSSEVSLTTLAEGLIGLIHVGTPGQIFPIQLDTTFGGNMVAPTSQTTVIGYRSDLSTSFVLISELGMYFMPEISSDGAPSIEALVADIANETYNIGGQLYKNITFGILTDSSRYNDIQALPFGGASGVIGLDRGSGLMYGIKDQLTEWTCSFDLYRLWNNGTWTLGKSPSRGAIAWTEALWPSDLWFPWWWITVTALSAGNRTTSIKWQATVASTHESLVWPQQLIDWYFEAIPSSIWSSEYETYSYHCNETLPDFVFGIGNGTFTIPGTYLPYQKDKTGTTCITLITGDNSTKSSYFGYPFGMWWAQLGVLILDYENGRVGFANKTMPLPTFDIDSLVTCEEPCAL